MAPRSPTPARPPLALETLEARETPAYVGGLDPSFGAGGQAIVDLGGTDAIQAVAVQSDGKIIGVGSISEFGVSDFLVARFNPDGSLDTSFNQGLGKRVIDFDLNNDFAHDVVIQPDGKIVVVGESTFGAETDFAVARLNPDGTPDTTFSGDGRNTYNLVGDDVATSVALQSDGTIVVGGYTDIAIPNYDFAVIRINPANGARTGIIQLVDFGGTDRLFDLAVYAAGPRKDQVVVVGDSNANALLLPQFAIARLSADLTSVQKAPFIFAPNDGLRAVAIRSDGKIVAAGYAADVLNPDFYVEQRNDDLAMDTSFNAAGTPGLNRINVAELGSDIASSVALQPDGKIVLTGGADTGGGGFIYSLAAARVNPDGTLDTSFNAAGPKPGTAVYPVNVHPIFDVANSHRRAALDANGRIVTPTSFASDSGVARLIGTVEKGRRLAVGGNTNASALVFSPTFTTGEYVTPAGATVAPFAGLGVNARTAVGDVNGDTVPDTILVTGPACPAR